MRLACPLANFLNFFKKSWQHDKKDTQLIILYILTDMLWSF